MKKVVIIVGWLLGMVAIGWSCSSRQATAHAVLSHAPHAEDLAGKFALDSSAATKGCI